jgi:hypothetical protein
VPLRLKVVTTRKYAYLHGRREFIKKTGTPKRGQELIRNGCREYTKSVSEVSCPAQINNNMNPPILFSSHLPVIRYEEPSSSSYTFHSRPSEIQTKSQSIPNRHIFVSFITQVVSYFTFFASSSSLYGCLMVRHQMSR